MSQNEVQDIDKGEILNDIEDVNDKVESELKPSSYDFLGKYSVDIILEVFGSWEDALDCAGVSEKASIIEDLRKVAEVCGDSFSVEDYADHGKYSRSHVNDIFGSWNKAKEKAGLETNASWRKEAISDYDLNQDLKRVARLIYGPLHRDEYDELGKYSEGTVMRRFDGWTDMRDQLELNRQKGEFEEKMSLERNRLHRDYLESVLDDLEAIEIDQEVIHKALKFHGSLKKSQRGKRARNTNEGLLVCLFQALRENSVGIRYKELMNKGDFETSGDFFGIMRTLKEFEDIQYNPVKASEFIERYGQILDLDPDVFGLSKEVAKKSSVSNSPSVTAAASIYISDQELSQDEDLYTQAEISEVFNITEVSLRKAKQNVREDINVEELKKEYE